MGYTETSEASKAKEATLASFTNENEDGLDDEPPKFLFEYRGKTKVPGAGTVGSTASGVRPAKQATTKSKQEQEQDDELARRAAAATKAKTDKKTK